MVKISRVNVHKHNTQVAKWANFIKNTKLQKEKKKEDEKKRRDEERVKSWKRRASVLFMEKLKTNEMEVLPKIDFKALKDMNGRNQTSERSDLGGDCICCYENFTNTTHKPIAFQCGHVVCASCAPMLKKCPTCSKDVINMIILHV